MRRRIERCLRAAERRVRDAFQFGVGFDRRSFERDRRGDPPPHTEDHGQRDRDQQQRRAQGFGFRPLQKGSRRLAARDRSAKAALCTAPFSRHDDRRSSAINSSPCTEGRTAIAGQNQKCPSWDSAEGHALSATNSSGIRWMDRRRDGPATRSGTRCDEYSLSSRTRCCVAWP